VRILEKKKKGKAERGCFWRFSGKRTRDRVGAIRTSWVMLASLLTVTAINTPGEGGKGRDWREKDAAI